MYSVHDAQTCFHPSFFQMSTRPSDRTPYRIRRADSNQPVTSIQDLSSGEAQLFILGIDILTIAAIWELQNMSQRVMLIDEPDVHIHPDFQILFADFLSQVSSHYQLQTVVATHSTALLSALGQF